MADRIKQRKTEFFDNVASVLLRYFGQTKDHPKRKFNFYLGGRMINEDEYLNFMKNLLGFNTLSEMKKTGRYTFTYLEYVYFKECMEDERTDMLYYIMGCQIVPFVILMARQYPLKLMLKWEVHRIQNIKINNPYLEDLTNWYDKEQDFSSTIFKF